MFYLDYDIIGVAETKLKGDEEIELPHYKFFTYNRQDLHIRANAGSGGFGVFVKNSILLTRVV